MSNPNAEENVVVELSRAEALVLFEWLVSQEDNLPFEDTAERDVLWQIEGILERALPEPLSPNYETALRAARTAVRESPRPRGGTPGKLRDDD